MKKGFTLIELIVVIAIIAIVAAIIAPSALKALEKARVARAVTDIKAIKAAGEALYIDTQDYARPVSGACSGTIIGETDLYKNASGYSGWNGPYLEDFSGRHPWGGYYWLTTGIVVATPPEPCPGGTARSELALLAQTGCSPTEVLGSCAPPRSSIERIDEILDDDNIWGTGKIGISGGRYYYILQFDFCPCDGICC